MNKKIYAAYGSNINAFQMSMRCPNARVFGQGLLHGYKPAFYGGSRNFSYATVLPCAGGSVPVLLWEITQKCERQLDAYEGFPKHYGKEQIAVCVETAKTVDCFAYIMNLKHRIQFLPSEIYFNTILDGYREYGFSEDILYAALKEAAGRI